MKNLTKNKNLLITTIILFILLFLSLMNYRIDLTKEKRYTLSDATIKTLESIKKTVSIDVYLYGDFPASFKQLQNETKFILEEFKKVNSKIDFKFIDPIKEKISKDTLQAMGLQPSVLPDVKNGKVSEIVLFPYATIKYNHYGTAVPLIIQQVGLDASEQLNKSIENLEYNLISSIKSITSERKKNIGILVNQEELPPSQFRSFIDMALENYNIGPINPENGKELSNADISKLKMMDALVIAKPRKPFTENEKIILDQYIINGGKTLWMIDAVNAEMDTLFQSKKIMAYPTDLNMTDFFFNYGVRINNALIKDFKKSALIRLSAGDIAENPQYKNFIWPYYPIGISDGKNIITKNINPVKFEFPTSIDTLSRKNIKTNVLFESSNRTTSKSTPNYVALSELVNLDSLGAMEQPTSPKIFGVSLEGKFTSAYSSRIEKNSINGFKEKSAKDNKMIIISDGDIAKNQILKGQALPLGADILTNQQYGNEQFLRNSLDWLLDNDHLMSLRNRNITMRLLDKQRIDSEKNKWISFNLLIPFISILILFILFFIYKKRKFSL